MNKEEIKKLPIEFLEKKLAGSKTMIGIFIPIILLLIFFGYRDYVNGETDWAINTISICSIGGLYYVFQEYNMIKKELEQRA